MQYETPTSQEIPPAPQKPDPDDCCGSGCVPCVFDYYYDQLALWQREYGGRESTLSISSPSVDTPLSDHD